MRLCRSLSAAPSRLTRAAPMSSPLRIAIFVNCFPVISETFILSQITGLLGSGHDVRIFADASPVPDSPVHEDVARFKLIERTTYINGPPESLAFDLPVFPLSARTWPPGEEKSIANWQRLARALPALFRCALRAPSLTRQVLSQRLYRYQAASLSSLYRLASLTRQPGLFDVL